MSSPRIGSPSSSDAAATRSGSLKWVVASTIARARRSGSSDLKIPEPTKLPWAPELHDERRVGRGGDAARAEERHRKPAAFGHLLDDLDRRVQLLGLGGELLAAQHAELLDATDDPPQVANRLDDVARAGLALGADHGRALSDPPQGLPEVGRAAHEGDLERVLVDVMRLVGGSEHLRLVDVVDLERLEHLGLREVADARFRHHRDRHRFLDLLDHLGARHPRDAAGGADVGRDPLQRHHRDRPGLLGDPRLLGGGDVHDHPALEHLGKPALDPEGGPFRHGPKYTGRPAGASRYFNLKARIRSLNAALSRA